jgi:ribosomal protein L7/L12
LDIYRANGCAYCHSQQVVQTGTSCDVLLTAPGTNTSEVVSALQKVKPGLSDAEAHALLAGGAKPVLRSVTKDHADAAAKTLTASGAKVQIWITPVGPDIARGWGKRRSVAQDFLFDHPVMPGSQRVGPDLANVGARQPDSNWHLRHLYAPATEVKGSTMPAYRFLFEKRKIQRSPSPEALWLPPSYAPPDGYEIVPRPEARALAAYMTSLRSDEPLFEAPLTVASAAPVPAPTNSPAGAEAVSSNAPGTAATNTPAR